MGLVDLRLQTLRRSPEEALRHLKTFSLEPEMALRISMDAVRTAIDRTTELSHEAVLFALAHPDRATEWREAYLVRDCAPHPERLTPLPRFE